MTPQQKIAELRAEAERASKEADRLEAEERAKRPEIRPGQVWQRLNGGDYWISVEVVNGTQLVPLDGLSGGWVGREGFGGMESQFQYVGLARDVLRVVEPEAVAQPEPEPTGAELVGKPVWVRLTQEHSWVLGGLECINFFDWHPSPYVIRREDGSAQSWDFAKLYREGVEP